MASRKIVKRKKVIVKPAPAGPKTISVGKPVETYIDVMGITFEQGTDHQFGKCRRIPGRYNNEPDQTVYKFVFDSEAANYIIWGRNQADRYVDVFNASLVNFPKQWVVVDWDSPVTTGTNLPADDDLYDDDGDDF